VIYSDNHGKTWQRGDIVVNVPDLADPSETVAVQLPDGRVMLNIRNENPEHRRAISYSADGATNWTKPVFDQQLYEPVCMASILQVSSSADSDKNRLLFCNPHSLEPRDINRPNDRMKKRQNLTAKLSYDDGRTWYISKAIDPDLSGYSDLAMADDGAIYCIYEQGVPISIACAKFNIEWLTNGKDKWVHDSK
jgi:sialidase-1